MKEKAVDKTVYKKPLIELFEIEKSDILTTSGGNQGDGNQGDGWGDDNSGGSDNSGGADIGPWDPIM